ncbi:MAG TPA: lysophospholipid acyltransferase family protein [Frankiaceae bacterium]|nr:lysophospholipid acyltransferase family protein [Frankiaceae bacterium]
MGQGNDKKLRHVALLRGARAAARLSISLAADYRLEVDLRLPSPAIFIAPHRSMFDIPLGIETFHRLGIAPLLVVSKSQLRSMRIPESNWDALDLLPISRDSSGRSSMLAAGATALFAGRSVAIMPEGKIFRGSGGKVRSGAPELAVRTGAPIVVLGSAGAEQFWQRGKPATFVNVSRKPVVVVVHDVVQPNGDTEDTRERVAASLKEAEARAQARLESAHAS